MDKQPGSLQASSRAAKIARSAGFAALIGIVVSMLVTDWIADIALLCSLVGFAVFLAAQHRRDDTD